MRTVVIAGVGLIGGSFARALRAAGFDGRIIGVSSPPAIAEALKCGVIDEAMPLEEAAPVADLIFLSQTIHAILATLPRLATLARPGCLITDAGSTKSAIVKAAGCIERAQFLGGHPMAGKETRGAASADAELFRGRTWILTPRHPEELDTAPAREFRRLIGTMGAVVVTLDAAAHDALVAHTSHLPQMLSTALAAMLDDKLALPGDALAAGPGLRDSTRLALSDFAIWRDILATNTANVAGAMDALIARLQALRSVLGEEAAGAEFVKAARFAAALRDTRKL